MDFEGPPESPTNGPRDRSAGSDSRIQSGMSGNSASLPDTPRHRVAEVVPIRPPAASPAEPEIYYPPVWMQRANLVMKFLICVWIGMILTVLPWTAAWSDNALIMSLPRLRGILTMDFVKGMISGIGLIDIWIGIWEAVHYHDHRPAPRIQSQ